MSSLSLCRMDDERAGGAETAWQRVRAGEPFHRPGKRGNFERWGDYCGHYCALPRKEFRVIRTFLKVAKSASPLRGTRKTRQCDFRKAEAKLVLHHAQLRAERNSRCRLIDGATLASLLSRPLWLYSRAKET
jgi:hypothetical protein